ncbi:MAG TPA: adenylate/guanylate cyclase domain-containing protein [Hyphomicrobiaceae bacterium]|jgi:class 3 adenylate cyclase/signal transduction histidine kinase
MSTSAPQAALDPALLTYVRQEFSGPVSAIIGYIDILEEDVPANGLDHLAPDIARLRRAAVSLQQLVKQIMDSNGGLSLELSKLRHDLRTPLNAIKGYAEMLIEEEPPEAFAQDLRNLLNESSRLLIRIEGLTETTGNASATASESTSADVIASSPALSMIAKSAPDDAAAEIPCTCHILVVDDHESNRDLLIRRLTREGHAVTTAASGEEALSLVEQDRFDLILLDLLMPGLSGFDVLTQLKNHPSHRDIPVIMISALDQIESVARCIEAGAEDYMPKPFNPVLLKARINACIEKKRLREREKMFLEQLKVEKEKSEALLLNILPMAIVSRLNLGETIIADHIPDSTILFADLVGFTGLSARLSATRLVKLLNMLFSEFDHLSLEFGLEKIKTIGDAYMVAGGLTARNSDHTTTVAQMALRMLEVSRSTSEVLGLPLQLRIGIDTGPVVAGIIGTHRFIYDVWGDTVNTASRMESHGVANEINVTEALYQRLRDTFVFEPRGTIEVAGKGSMQAYFLRGARE